MGWIGEGVAAYFDALRDLIPLDKSKHREGGGGGGWH